MKAPARRFRLLWPLWLATLVSCAALRGQAPSAPAWWEARGVLAGLPSADTATVSAQQLYNFALAALLELDSKLAGAGGATGTLSAAAALLGTPQPLPGLHAEYFHDSYWETPMLIRQETTGVDFDWGGSRWDASIGSFLLLPAVAPGPGVNERDFRARWLGEVVPAQTGLHVVELRRTGQETALSFGGGMLESYSPDKIFSLPLNAGQPAGFNLSYHAPEHDYQGAILQARWGRLPAPAHGFTLHATYLDEQWNYLGEEDVPTSDGPIYSPAPMAFYEGFLWGDPGWGVLAYAQDHGGGLWGSVGPWNIEDAPANGTLGIGYVTEQADGIYPANFLFLGGGSFYLGIYGPPPAWDEMSIVGQTDALGQWRAYENLSLLNGTVGRLRAFALALRARLAAIGYTNLPTIPIANDTTVLTVGDLKALFNFDLDSFDYDGDGRTYAEEIADDTDPFDYFNGETPVIVTIEGGNQTGPPGHFLEYPWTVRIKTTDGVPLINAPVTFSLAEEEAGFLSVRGDSSTPLVRSLVVRSDAAGYAWVYLMP